MGAAVFGVGQGYVGNNSTRQRGTDLLENMSITNQTYPTGDVVLSASVTAQSTRRLKDLASTFQRIKWHRLVFTVEGAFPTTTGGGYIAAFVRDPTDQPPADGLERLRWVAARSCMVDCKWYDCGRVIVPQTPDLQYTSHDAQDDPRWWSPGTLYIISKGGPGQPGSLTIKMDWDITLSMPSSEKQEEATPTSTFPQDLALTYQVTSPGYIGVVEQLSLTGAGVATYGPPMNSFIDGLEPGTMIQIGHPLILNDSNGRWNTTRFVVDSFEVATKSDGTGLTMMKTLFPVKDPQDPSTVNFFGAGVTASHGICIPAGTSFTATPPGTQVVANFMNIFTPKGIKKIKTAGLSLQTVQKPVASDWPTVNANISGEVYRQ